MNDAGISATTDQDKPNFTIDRLLKITTYAKDIKNARARITPTSSKDDTSLKKCSTLRLYGETKRNK